MYRGVVSADAVITAGSSGSARRAELLALAYDYVLERGLAGPSLRPLAAATGTSPRVLLYLLDSKEGLVRELLARAREGQLALVRARLENTEIHVRPKRRPSTLLGIPVRRRRSAGDSSRLESLRAAAARPEAVSFTSFGPAVSRMTLALHAPLTAPALPPRL